MNLHIDAFFWGIVSAVSLPLGAILGLWLKPKQKINSTLMAFGTGALLFALSIEIFGHVPHHVKTHGMFAFFFSVAGAISGGVLFDFLNQILNNRGAFLRRLSNAKKYVAELKIKRTKKLVEELSSVKVLCHLKPEHIGELIHHIRKDHFKKGQMIFNQGDPANEMYFIINGKVEIILFDKTGSQKLLTVMEKFDTFGELGILRDIPRTASVKAVTDVRVYKILKSDLDEILVNSPELQKDLNDLANNHLNELSIKSDHKEMSKWKHDTLDYLENFTQAISPAEVDEEGEVSAKAGKGAALAIWLGILIDGIPESLVIGMLAISVKGMSMAFIAGVFLANLPEAMSSAVSMRKYNMSIKKILMMWGSICLLTGAGAFLGANLFPSNPTGYMFYFVLYIEGLAAGAMLTMIAETMMPEAFEQGGAIVGISTLAGFLTALYVKVI